MKINCAYQELVDLVKLVPNPKNANVHTDQQIKLLAKLMDFQGWRHPVIVSKLSGFIVAGHGRVEAARLNGWEQAPVDYQEFENEAQEYAFLISDNKIAELAETDLAKVNVDAMDLGPDFDLDLLGIPDFVIEPIEKLDPQCDEDEVPEHVEPKTKLGDIYQLGRHRLMCGDSASIDAVEKLMAGEKANMVFTDPPYNLGGHMDAGIFNNVTNSHGASKALEKANWDKDFDITSVLSNLQIVADENCSIYICTSHFLAGQIWGDTQKWCDRIGWCIWDKPNPAPSLQNRHWTWSAELICYATRGKHIFNPNPGTHTSNVWRIQVERHDTGHVAQKPVAIPEMAIIHSSNSGQSVLDLFGGSGSTLIACEKTNRQCFMMELDPYYCSVIVERWRKFTGKEAYLIKEDGAQVPWSEIANGNQEAQAG